MHTHTKGLVTWKTERTKRKKKMSSSADEEKMNDFLPEIDICTNITIL